MSKKLRPLRGRLSRTPPRAVRSTLRTEVGFVCPWPECGSPFLTFHHFNPPWRVREHHEPAGMLALCPVHAALADSDNYTAEFFRELKRRDVLAAVEFGWPWEPEVVTFVVGSNVLLSTGGVLNLGRTQLLRFKPHECGGRRRIHFDLFLYDPNGRPLVSMRDNVFEAPLETLRNLDFTPRSKAFLVEHTCGMSLSMRFERLTADFLCERLEQVRGPAGAVAQYLKTEPDRLLDSDGVAPVVSLECNLYAHNARLRIDKRQLRAQFRGRPENDPIILRGMFLAPGGCMRFQISPEGTEHSIDAFCFG